MSGAAIARGNVQHFRNLAYSVAGSTGLAMWPFMPASMHARRSSLKALAVIAMIGRVAYLGRQRIAPVATIPSNSGICCP